MKHVGLNVAADAFMNSAVTGVNGGLVLAVADDPGMHSSQNEQDSRYYAQFALIPCLEPRNQQEAYDMTREAFDIPSELALPVMVRLVTRLAHSRAGGRAARAAGRRTSSTRHGASRSGRCCPSNARVAVQASHRQAARAAAPGRGQRRTTARARAARRGVIACGIAENYLRENLDGRQRSLDPEHPPLPVPAGKIRQLVEHVDELLSSRTATPSSRTWSAASSASTGVQVKGRMTGELPRTGELNPDLVREALGLPPPSGPRAPARPTSPAGRPPCARAAPTPTPSRPSTRPSPTSTTRRSSRDIGCYTLAALPPLEAIHSCVDMGA